MMDVLARVLGSDEYLCFLGGMLLAGVLCWVCWRPRPHRALSRREVKRLLRDIPMRTAGAGDSPGPVPAVPTPRRAYFEDGAGRVEGDVAGVACPASATPGLSGVV